MDGLSELGLFFCATYFYRRHRFWVFLSTVYRTKREKSDPSTQRYTAPSVVGIYVVLLPRYHLLLIQVQNWYFTTFYFRSPCLIPVSPTNLYTINSLPPIEVNIFHVAAGLRRVFIFLFFSFPFTHLEVDPSLLGWSRCMWRGMYCARAERCSEGGKGRVVKWRIWFPLLFLFSFFPLFTSFIWGWRYYGKCSKNFVFAFLYYVLEMFPYTPLLCFIVSILKVYFVFGTCTCICRKMGDWCC